MPEASRQSSGFSQLVPAVAVGAALCIIAWQSPRAVLFLVTDGVIAAAILAAASLGGLWLAALFRLGDLPLRWHLLLGAGLGIGVLATLVLALGLAGVLTRLPWLALLVGAGGAGVIRLALLLRRAPQRAPGPAVETPLRHRASWLWLVACPFAALALLVALVPPGLLWVEEGNAYDVLEYHLQMPREYLESGRIEYAPHNVYANFPACAEMLYLLAMVVGGGPLAGASVAKLINALLALLTVAAAWLAGREAGRTTGVCTGLLAATAGWLTYLSGVAYVENAMLFFAMLSAAAIVRAGSSRVAKPLRWIALAGALAGFSAACKYTAVALVVLPLALAVLIGHWPALRRRAVAFGIFALGAVAALSPWMLKNAAFTHNPVFPLAGDVFRDYPEGWSAACRKHFERAHAPGPDQVSIGARFGELWSKVVADDSQRFGPAVFLLALGGLITGRGRRPVVQYGVVLLVQLGLWLGLTHLYARFAVVFLVPLVILGGRFLGELRTPLQKAGLLVLLGGAVWNLIFLAGLYRTHLYTDAGRISIEGTPGVFTTGRMPGHRHLSVINDELPEGSKLLLVGEARAFYFLGDVSYCTVFNRNPFVEAVEAATDASDVGAWLTAHGYTHVYVGWSEIGRLRRSRYGFSAAITPDRFERLTTAGVLMRTHTFALGAAGRSYADLYEVARN